MVYREIYHHIHNLIKKMVLFYPVVITYHSELLNYSYNINILNEYPVVNGGSDLERLGYPYSQKRCPISEPVGATK